MKKIVLIHCIVTSINPTLIINITWNYIICGGVKESGGGLKYVDIMLKSGQL